MFARQRHKSVPSIQYIVNALRPGASLTGLNSLSEDEWDTVAVTAIALGLAPLLHNHLSRAGVSLPPMAMAKLAVTRQAHARRNAAIAGQLAEILTACAREHVQPLVLKGALLAFTAYPEPALRPMNDIDLLFHPRDIAAAENILTRLGYTGRHTPANRGPGVTKHLSTYRRAGSHNATPNPFLSAGENCMVEPHLSLEESWFGLKVNMTPGVWERAVSLELPHLPACRLSTPDLLLHLAVHATFHVIMGRSVFVQLYDIGRVLYCWPDELDWSDLLALAGRAQARPFLFAGLYWAARLYQAAVPAAVLDSLEQACPPNLAAYIKSLDAGSLFAKTQHRPLVTLWQRFRRGLLDRRETARWAGGWRNKWRVWQTALVFYKTDTAALLRRKLKAQSP